MYWFAPVFAGFIVFASIGVYLNYGKPDWNKIGVNKWEIRQNIGQFPEKYCLPETMPACKKVSKGILKYLGL